MVWPLWVGYPPPPTLSCSIPKKPTIYLWVFFKYTYYIYIYMYILHLHKSFLKFITECTIFPFNTIWNCLPKKWRKNARLLFPFSYFHFILSCILLHVGVYILAQKILISPPNGRKYFPDFFSRYSLKILPFINFLSKVPPPRAGGGRMARIYIPWCNKEKKKEIRIKRGGIRKPRKGRK